MGIVYEAVDVDRGERVALKTIRNPSAEALAHFKREFRALQDVSHPNLVHLDELVSYEGQWFFTMELVEGEGILAYVRPGWHSQQEHAHASAETVDVAAAASDASLASPTRAHRHGGPPYGLPALDEARLRSSLRQLAGAIHALHERGMVHRDIKPSNVRVDASGRAVLLDFGLVLDLSADAMLSVSRVAGTPHYMAPEQATQGAVGPEADWYAFGVLLYEALAGALPIAGAPLAVMLRKQRDDPPPPSSIASGVPADLERLCMALLRFDPAARPTGDAVIQALGGDDAVLRTRSQTAHAPFVGRERELSVLHDAYASVATTGKAAAVLVRGESGVGKTCLVRRFVEACALADPKLLLFAGRCYEREAVPYKAFDGVIDAMTRVLLRMPLGGAAYFPTRTDALAEVFPVLGRLPDFRKSGQVRPAIDPHELRGRAFTALREMLERLAAKHPVILLVDDIQWADVDSLALLAEVTRGPDAPPVLLVATMRVLPDAERGEGVSDERVASAFSRLRVLDLTRLSAGEGRNLARLLVERWAPGAENASEAEAIADGAEGHPLFIEALVHHRAALGPRAGPLRLDEALYARVAAADATARLLVELLAVAGTPVKQEALIAAAAAERAEDVSRAVSSLRVEHLVSIRGGRASDAIELYHDRIRTAVLAHMDAETSERRHRALAQALERIDASDVEALARLWRGAGDAKTAARYAEAAGAGAASALAFDRAAAWYETAIELGAPTGEAGRAIREKLGDALANAGRGARAARAYHLAAEGAPAARCLDLQRRAADQLLRGGHFDEGIDALSAVLATIGMRLPATPFLALLSLLWWRLWVRVRGLAFAPRDPTEIAAAELTKVDTCWSVSFGLAMVDSIRGAAFQARHLALALKAGEVHRVQRALAIEIPYVARSGAPAAARVEELTERAEKLTLELNDPAAMGYYYACLALANQLLGRFRAGLGASDSAEVFLRDCAGSAWELANARIFGIMSLSRLGMMKELCRRQPLYLHDALERGDLYAAVHFRVGHASLRWIVEDDIETGRAEAAEAMSIWSGRAFHTEHFYELFAHTHFDMYTGDVARARARVLERWGPMRRSLLLLVQGVRVLAVQMRANTAIALAASGARGGADLLAHATRDARALARERVPWAVAYAQLAFAGIEAARGPGANAERVTGLLRTAITGFETSGLAMLAAATRHALGGYVGGEEGRGMVRAAEEWMRSEAVVAPEKMARLLTPGLER